MRIKGMLKISKKNYKNYYIQLDIQKEEKKKRIKQIE